MIRGFLNRHVTELLTFVSLLILSVAWSLAVPLRAQPDETAHAVYAAAVARGQYVVDSYQIYDSSTENMVIRYGVRVPSSFADVQRGAECLFWQPENPDTCVTPIPDESASEVIQATSAANYPPLYYALVGWPSLFLDGSHAWMAMRLITAVVVSSFLTIGTWGLRTGTSSPLAVAVLGVITPTTLAYGAAINPAGPEIAALFALSGLLAPYASHNVSSSRRIVTVGLVAAFAINMRPTSALWVALVIGAIATGIPRSAWTQLRGSKHFWIGSCALALGTVSALLWSIIARPDGSLLGIPAPDMSIEEMLAYMTRSLFSYWDSIIGNFGWADNPVAPALLLPLFLAYCLLLLFALKNGTRRHRFGLIAGLFSLLLSAVAIQYALLDSTGMMWQGRYWLPPFSGLATYCVALVARSRQHLPHLARILGVSFVAVHGIVFFNVVHRYASGFSAPIAVSDFTTRHICALILAFTGLTLTSVLFGYASLNISRKTALVTPFNTTPSPSTTLER